MTMMTLAAFVLGAVLGALTITGMMQALQRRTVQQYQMCQALLKQIDAMHALAKSAVRGFLLDERVN